MIKQRHEARFAWPITPVFAAVVEVVGKHRWSGAPLAPSAGVRAGSDYVRQRGKVLRRGKVAELCRPVALTLQETLLDPPCCVQLRLNWRLEPLESGALVRLDARFSLNGAASLRRRHWSERIHGHCARMLAAVGARLAAQAG